MSNVILSSPMMLECGDFTMEQITLNDARTWVLVNKPTNYVGHATVRVLGLEPATSREVCTGYERALVLKVNGRLDFGREYTSEEIEEIGVTCYLITKN